MNGLDESGFIRKGIAKAHLRRNIRTPPKVARNLILRLQGNT